MSNAQINANAFECVRPETFFHMRICKLSKAFRYSLLLFVSLFLFHFLYHNFVFAVLYYMDIIFTNNTIVSSVGGLRNRETVYFCLGKKFSSHKSTRENDSCNGILMHTSLLTTWIVLVWCEVMYYLQMLFNEMCPYPLNGPQSREYKENGNDPNLISTSSLQESSREGILSHTPLNLTTSRPAQRSRVCSLL